MDFTEKMQFSSGLGLPEFVEALEIERKKIQVFQKELPLSLELVTQAIERCNQQLSGTTVEYLQGHSECSEQTSSEQHVFEEFIPMKRTSSPDNDEEGEEEHSDKPKEEENFVDKKKSDWLRSVQLWNPNPDPPVKEDMPRKPTVDLKKNGGAFQPFKREKSVGKTNGSVVKAPVSVPATSSSVGTVSEGNDGSVKKEEKESQSQRKQRRNWSQELHRRFLNALQQLGGSHAATPKQIRELMKVDGLTNDEVKSHLQKYRLHTRRPSSIHNNSNAAQTPQFVVVGGLWVPPPDYAAISTPTTMTTAPVQSSNVGPATEIYAPVAIQRHMATQGVGQMIQRQQQKQSESSHSDERVSHSERGVHSNSPDTSCSTHMTSTSGF